MLMVLCSYHWEIQGKPQTTIPTDISKIELPGLDNVFRVMDKLYSGSGPEDEAAFKSLEKLGIKTVISVDGAKPNLVLAKKYGLRYVHLPIGYDGISRDQALRLAKAVLELPGPIYLHCHHGKHRGPAAAAVVRFCLEDQCSVSMAVEVMKRAGTDPRYQGLYAAPSKITSPTSKDLADLSPDFPETTKFAPLAQAMVAIDIHWDHLTETRKAGWKTPANHPDIDPAHEALQVVEHYREITRLPNAKERPEDFQRFLESAEKSASALECLLRAGKKTAQINGVEAEKFFQQSKMACNKCHAKYRDGLQP